MGKKKIPKEVAPYLRKLADALPKLVRSDIPAKRIVTHNHVVVEDRNLKPGLYMGDSQHLVNHRKQLKKAYLEGGTKAVEAYCTKVKEIYKTIARDGAKILSDKHSQPDK